MSIKISRYGKNPLYDPPNPLINKIRKNGLRLSKCSIYYYYKNKFYKDDIRFTHVEIMYKTQEINNIRKRFIVNYGESFHKTNVLQQCNTIDIVTIPITKFDIIDLDDLDDIKIISTLKYNRYNLKNSIIIELNIKENDLITNLFSKSWSHNEGKIHPNCQNEIELCEKYCKKIVTLYNKQEENNNE